MKILVVGIIIVILKLSIANGANIMFFFGVDGYSHRISVWPLVEKLADRGHSITFVSPFPNKTPHPKVKDYVPKALKTWADSLNDTSSLFSKRKSGQMEQEWFKLPNYGISMCTILLTDLKFVDWVNKSKFDLVVIDGLTNECGYGIAYKLKAKLIVFNTANSYPYFPDPFGYPDESSWLPDVVYHPPQDMNIYHRFMTMMVPLYFNYLREFDYFPKLEEIIKDKLEVKDMPSLAELERNVSLVLLNHHYAEDYARPLPPNVIPVGGMHCAEVPEKLPKDLEDFINQGRAGFIYMSFGSFAKFSTFPKKTQNVFLNTIKKLKNVQFIWKLDKDGPHQKDLPANVYTAKWMPQQAILAHQKIRGFITHGGLLGIQEAICNSVPLITFPIFAEQDYNAGKIESREIGIALEITTVTQLQFQDAINKIIGDERYHKNMKIVSVAFRDRAARPVDTAVWWTEFVLRHHDTNLLRPGSVHQSWWKRRQLDIWAILFLITLVLIMITFSLIKFVLSLIFRSKKTEISSQKLKSK